MVQMLGCLQTVPELSQPLILLLLFSQDDPVLRRLSRVVSAITTTTGIVRSIRISALTTTVHVDVCHVGGWVTKGVAWWWACHVGRVKGGVARWASHLGRVKGGVMAGRVVVGVAGRQVCTMSSLA
jgi:hypothetical protein